MPLAIAVIGIVGTTLVTNSQIESSNNLAKAQQKIKIIEIFSDKITNKDDAERGLAIKVLKAVDPELGQKIAYAIENTELDVKSTIDGNEYSLAKDVQIEIKTQNIESSDKNSKFRVGFYALNVSEEKFRVALNYIKDSGYSIVAESLLKSKPTWMGDKSTVFYYDNSSKDKANDIAEGLSKITKSSFAIKRGAGLGVPRGQEKIRFFVHYLNAS